MQGGLTIATRATQRLAIDGDVLKVGDLGQGLDPGGETMLEGLRIEAAEDVTEAVRARGCRCAGAGRF